MKYKKILKLIKKIKEMCPELRIGQIMENASSYIDLFYIKDKDLIIKLKKFLKEYK